MNSTIRLHSRRVFHAQRANPLLAALLGIGIACLSSDADAQYAQALLANNPTVLYQLGESGGSVAANSGSAGSSLNGTYHNLLSGDFGQAGGLVGDSSTAVALNPTRASNVGSYISVSPSVFSGLTSGTIEARIKLNSLVNQTITSMQSDNQFSGAIFDVGGTSQLSTSPGILGFQSKNGHDAYSNTALTTGAWYDVAVTFSGTGATFYINGASAGSTSGNFNLPSSNSAATLLGGWHSSGGGTDVVPGFDGDLMDVAVYNAVLTPSEIEDQYLAGTMATTPEPGSLAVLVGVGIAGSLALRRRRRNRRSTMTPPVVLQADQNGHKPCHFTIPSQQHSSNGHKLLCVLSSCLDQTCSCLECACGSLGRLARSVSGGHVPEGRDSVCS